MNRQTQSSPRNFTQSRRHRGMTSVLAMLFVTIFGVMALGFYASTMMSVQIAGNERRITDAYLSAESGMDFMRYHLARVSIPPGTTSNHVMDELYNDLQTLLATSPNLQGLSISRSGNTIKIPSAGAIRLDADGNTSFRATITEWAGEVVVKSEGLSSSGEVTRAITMDFTRQQRVSSVFDFAIASKGQILMKKGAVTSVPGVDPLIATMMSTLVQSDAIKVTGGTIGGELTVLDGADAIVSGGTVAGSSNSAYIYANNVNYMPDPPEFPTFDPTVYKQYATALWKNNTKTQSNIRVPKNSGTAQHPVTFNANDVVQGILYIEAPNYVKFNGNFNLKGFIVMEENPGGSDFLDFRGNVTMSPVPNSSQFDALRATSGVAILAPTAAITMSGSSDSQVRGSVIANTFGFAGSADMQIDQGTLITLKAGASSAEFNGKTVRFSATGASNLPTAGVIYASSFAPNPQTYQEVSP